MLLRAIMAALTVLFSLWVFTLVGPPVIDALGDQADATDSVENGSHNYSDDVDQYQQVTILDAPTLLGAGFIILLIAFAAFRTRFSARRR